MSSKINVLVFPDGEINSVEIHDALSFCVNINLYGASSIERHGPYIFKNHISNLPKISDPIFFDELRKLVEKYNIDVIIPTHDTVALELIRNQDKLGCKVLGGDINTAEICRSKKLTYDCFKNYSFIPKTYSDIQDFEYPLIIKPDKGQGGQGVKLIKSKEELPVIDIENYVICEYLPGEEFTVDCLSDRFGNLCYISPRSRKRILGGVCTQGCLEELTDEINQIAHAINNKLIFCGLWYFQIKKDISGNFKLLEISNRCAGTMCLSRARGVNLPLLSVYTLMGRDICVNPNKYQISIDRTLINRYKIDYDYNCVYFDLDDTLIIDNKVNLNSIRFLYQCKNKNIPVYLLTKHADNVIETLNKFAIDTNLFKQIIHIDDKSAKSDYITEKKSIFIDNAFAERHKVLTDKSIPVFDVDAIEVLLDWRC